MKLRDVCVYVCVWFIEKGRHGPMSIVVINIAKQL